MQLGCLGIIVLIFFADLIYLGFKTGDTGMAISGILPFAIGIIAFCIQRYADKLHNNLRKTNKDFNKAAKELEKELRKFKYGKR